MSKSGKKSKPCSFLLFFMFLFGLSASSWGKPNTISSNVEQFYALDDFLIFEDTNSLFTVDQIAQRRDESFSYDINSYTPQMQPTLWLKLKIPVGDSLEQKWIMEIFNHRAAEIIVFRQSHGKWLAIDTVGEEVPFYERNLYNRAPTFEIPLQKGENQLIIKFKPRHYLAFNCIIKPYQSFINYYNIYYFVIGGFYFVLLMLMLYNLLFYISTLDKVYLYYILFVITSALDCLRVDHIGFAIFWPNHPEVNNYIDEFVRPLFIFGIVNYASYFLWVKKDFPKLHLVLWSVFGAFAVFRILCSISPWVASHSRGISEVFIFPMLCIIMYVAIIRLIQGQKPVRIFIIGYSSIFLGLILIYGFYNGWIQGNSFVYYVLFYGIGVDTFMFSFALSARLRYERIEKERALKAESHAKQKVIEQMQENEVLLNKVNAELEEKVQERTLEIEASKRKLAEQAKIINDWNLNLDKENWKLNKTIKSLKIRKVIPENQTYAQIQELFPTETECYNFIADLKWHQGFCCRKCGNTKETNTHDFYSRRCSKCGSIESITANTLFHQLKFPLDKAFYIAYCVFTSKDLNLSNISREIDLNYKTCQKFKIKIEEAMETLKKRGIKVKSWEDVILEN